MKTGHTNVVCISLGTGARRELRRMDTGRAWRVRAARDLPQCLTGSHHQDAESGGAARAKAGLRYPDSKGTQSSVLSQ